MSEQSFLIPEILAQVFEHLSPDSNSPEFFRAKPPWKKDLISCALSCKMFAPSALSLVWRRMDTIFPLFKLLPGFQLVDSHYVLTDLLTEADLVRFDYYAPFIKEYHHFRQRLEFLDPSDEILSRFSSSVYSRITRLRPVLLPSLTTFDCDAGGFDERMEIDAFVSPSLKNIMIHSASNLLLTAEIFMYFPLLGSQALDIQKLWLSIQYPGSPSCFRTIPHLKNLRFLDLSFEEESFLALNTVLHDIENLGTLEYLEELSICGSYNPEATRREHAPRSSVTPDSFKNLKSLKLDGEYALVKTVFDLCQYSPICRLEFDSPELDSRMTSVIKHALEQWTSTLEHLTNYRYFGIDPNHKIVLDMSGDIEPLMSLSNLRNLTIRADALEDYLTFIFREENVVTIMGACPGLEELWLSVRPKDFESAPSVAVLKVLADKGRNLKRIKMPLNLVDVPEPSTSNSLLDPSSVRGLETFEISVNPCVLRERLSDVRADRLAHHIWKTFPRVQDVYGSFHASFGELWNSVQEEVKKLQCQGGETDVNIFSHLSLPIFRHP
ncbi:hypothetical protein VKT23_016330 [Stygiomarasmius scandens]|uniref:F-box domain-containing protein n=1 Tax=Marasmiellus scandens TaxID=2682957 RepID=A0ABR1IZM0_9AGAR